MPSRIRLTIDKGRVVEGWLETTGEGWVIAYRVVFRSDLHPRVAEVRVFPDEGRDRRASGTWSGSAERVPVTGLPTSILGRVRVTEPIRQLAEELAARPDLMTGMRLPSKPLRKGASPVPRRGRKGHTDAFLAAVAAEYDVASREGSRSPVKEIAQRRDQPVARVRGWVYQARERGFLLGRGQGRKGGMLSPKAKEVGEADRQLLSKRRGREKRSTSTKKG